MTGRHEAPVQASDSWLTDQWAAWQADVERFFTLMDTRAEQFAGMSIEQIHQVMSDDSLRKTVLLCTARQLAFETLRRAR